MSHAIHQISVGGFDNNFSYLIADSITRQAYVVDPCGDFIKLSAQIDAHQYHIVGVLLTHTHHDHMDKIGVAVTDYHAPIYVYKAGLLEVAKYEDVRSLDDGTQLPLGTGHITTLYTPGHTDDSVCFFISAEDADDGIPKVITGDTLFVGGCGRTTELRVKDLYESLAELAALPGETVILPGHNYGDTPTSTINHEKTHNKYYLAKNFNEFYELRLG